MALLSLDQCIICLDLESPKDRSMHPTESKARKWSNMGFPLVEGIINQGLKR